MDKRLCAVVLSWLATMRRYSMEEQCTWHPGWQEKPNRSKYITKLALLASRIWLNVPRILMPKTLPEWWINCDKVKVCCHESNLRIEVRNPLSSLIKSSAQGVTVADINASHNQILATLDPQHYFLAPMFHQTSGMPNVALFPKMCHCGSLHLQVTTIRPVPAFTPLIVELKPFQDTHHSVRW